MKKYWSTTKGNFRRNSSTKRVRVLVAIIGIALVVGFLAPRAASSVASFILQPVTLLERWLRESESLVPAYVRSRAALEAEQTALRDALALQAGQDEVIAALRAENDELRAQLGYATSSLVSARILQQPPLVPYDRLVINRGTRDGVVLDAPVFAGENVLVGRVVQVTQRQSIVTLLSNPGVESTVYIFGPDIYTTAEGLGGGIVRVGVPQGVPLAVGDPVSVPAAGLGMLGAITYIETEATRPEQFGFVQLPVALRSLQYVLVGTEPLTPIDFDEARETVAATRSDYFTVPVPEGVLVDIPEQGTSTATSTATTTDVANIDPTL
jgi:cell shape-determining protein MreC